MQIKCKYCGNYIKDTDKVCLNCGATNENLNTETNETPKTIEELKAWYKERNLPDETITRFFIGKDIREPKAFGIYEKEEGYFVVYKNKDTGIRVIRYEGQDEAYAVNELYLKLRSEILHQKTLNHSSSSVHTIQPPPEPKYRLKEGGFAEKLLNLFIWLLNHSSLVIVGAFIFIQIYYLFIKGTRFTIIFGCGNVALFFTYFTLFITSPFLVLLNRNVFGNKIPSKVPMLKKKVSVFVLYALLVFTLILHKDIEYETVTYYKYGNTVYCEYQDNYYQYNTFSGDYDSKSILDLPPALANNPDDYLWEYSDADWHGNFVDFEDSTTYDDLHPSSSSSDWDSSDSWDSGGTDWGSDW